tara:strand:- start:1322 stop:2587 length:1266 start_codon:yes stop_codon:yes gene_type:complete
MNKKIASKINTKQKKISTGNTAPTRFEGFDGELTIRHILGQGIFLFYKWGGKWYSARFSQYTRSTHERNEPVYLPKGKKPKSIGEITMDNDNKIKIKKSSAVTQVVSMDKDKKLDVSEIQTSRTSTTSMTTDNAGNPDLLLVNTSGHVNLHLQTRNSDYDPFIIYSHLNAGETTTLRQWVIGMDNNDGDVFNYCYKNSGTTPLTPSTTTSSEVKMALTTGGALTTTGTITGLKLAATNTAAATSDTDKFLVVGESGATSEVRYRTGAQVRSDIGAGTADYYYETKVVNWVNSGTSQIYLPIAGYIFEQTGTGSRNEYVGMVAPYNGTVEKFMFRCEEAQDGTLEFDILEASDGTENPGTTIGVKDTVIDIADDTSVEVTFSSMTSGTNALVKGRIYAFRVDTPSAPNDANGTLVFKWDITS